MVCAFAGYHVGLLSYQYTMIFSMVFAVILRSILDGLMAKRGQKWICKNGLLRAITVFLSRPMRGLGDECKLPAIDPSTELDADILWIEAIRRGC